MSSWLLHHALTHVFTKRANCVSTWPISRTLSMSQRRKCALVLELSPVARVARLTISSPAGFLLIKCSSNHDLYTNTNLICDTNSNTIDHAVALMHVEGIRHGGRHRRACPRSVTTKGESGTACATSRGFASLFISDEPRPLPTTQSSRMCRSTCSFHRIPALGAHQLQLAAHAELVHHHVDRLLLQQRHLSEPQPPRDACHVACQLLDRGGLNLVAFDARLLQAAEDRRARAARPSRSTRAPGWSY